jgi:class 3 adenylate cyclase
VRDAAQSALSELRVRKHPRCEVLFPMRRIAGGRKGTGPASGRPPPFAPRAEQPLQAQEESEGERKTVTALFADIKGSMELMEDLDPEEARGIVDPALKLMIDAVHRYDGYIVQSTGDGIFTLFGAPLAHEDHPQRALYAALRMQEEMRRYDHRMRARGQTPIQVRIGVNTCEVVVRSIQTGADHTEYTPIGHSISLAARLQSLATTGSTIISGYRGGSARYTFAVFLPVQGAPRRTR